MRIGAEQEIYSDQLELVATFNHQATGVSVHPTTGRIFVNFPRWTEDAPISVAEVLPSKSIVPFPPNSDWNSWRRTDENQLDPSKYFICVQSVLVFEDSLFVLDPAAPAIGNIVKGGPKLVEIDLIRNETKRTILFNEILAPQGSYLNDVRLSPDGNYAYITDSGAIGAIVVVNLRDVKLSRRLLHGHPSTQKDENIIVKHRGIPIVGPTCSMIEGASDGIALSVDGTILYWQSLRGSTLYSIETRVLQSSVSIAENIRTIGRNGPADGLWISRKWPDLLFVSSVEDDRIRVRNLITNEYRILLTDSRLRWPDTFSEDGNDYIYVTSSRIQDSAWFVDNAPVQLETQLWRFKNQ